ncbi:MAG TPA: alpha/beta fold hydrolase [Verrucomicrobiae bacterium]|nr:alpha/beta fold hydrolase [Verrucomicrobiae bacterium]
MPQVRANGINIEYESFGDETAPALLLIMGLGAQLLLWPDDFCEGLAAGGYRVIRFDNRDVGLSSKIEHPTRPKLMRAALASLVGLPVKAPYTLDDMARDTVGLMDALGLHSAHVVGASMGGMIAQIVAAKHPDRVASLTLIMTTSGNPRLPGPRLDLRLRLVRPPQALDRETLVRHSMDTWRLIASPEYPPDEPTLRAKCERSYDRSSYRRGLARQTLAIIASGSRVGLLKRITAPTLVLHGEDDPLVPVAAGHELAQHIPGARLEVIPGWGHDFPAALLDKLTRWIVEHARLSDNHREKNKA